MGWDGGDFIKLLTRRVRGVRSRVRIREGEKCRREKKMGNFAQPAPGVVKEGLIPLWSKGSEVETQGGCEDGVRS